MTLLPDEVVSRIPSLHSQDTLPDEQLIAYARLTLAEAGLTWFVLELHTDGDTFSAYLIDPQQEQFGYFSFAYLEEHLGIATLEVLGELPGEKLILGVSEVPSAIAYDQQFTQKRLVDAVREERSQRRAKGEGLPTYAPLASHRAYYYAVSFPHDAAQVYQIVRDIVLNEPVNLSAFRVPPPAISHFWYIIVIGDRPPEAIHERIMNALEGGTVTTIPYDLLMQLFARKLEENSKGERREHQRTIKLKRKQKRTPKRKLDPRHRGK